MKVDEKRRNVRKVVDRLIKSRIENFMPNYIAYMTGTNVDEAEKFLDELTLKGAEILRINYKFICPECSKVKYFEKASDYFEKASDLVKFKQNDYEWPICGSEIPKEDIENNTFKTYSFDKEYRERRKKQ
nr:MAG TPA: Transcription initiation factor IIE, alpha FINGER, Transcription [Caudoviricetes sp.]